MDSPSPDYDSSLFMGPGEGPTWLTSFSRKPFFKESPLTFTKRGKKKRSRVRVYNIGNTSPVPVGKLVAILESLLKVKAKKNVIKMPRNGDVPYTHANVSLAGRDFGYKPTTDLATGLRKFVQWYVRYYGVHLGVEKENHQNYS